MLVVLPDDDTLAILSKETECAGRVTVFFSPQFENVTVPWMADDHLRRPGFVTSSRGRVRPLAGT